MSDFQQLAIKETLKSELGEGADFWLYDRSTRNPMNFVLDKVQEGIGNVFSVYWVKDGPPEVFTISGFEISPVVFSTRYLSLNAFLRHLLVDIPPGPVLIDAARRACLKIMAELSLRYGDPDLAVTAFAASIVDKGVWLDDGDRLEELEQEPITERYMATWFFGLAHELGHLATSSWSERFANGQGLYSDAWMLQAIEHTISNFPFPESLRVRAVDAAKCSHSGSVLEINHLRDEGIADIFAASVMFAATFELMKTLKGPRFELENFVAETVIFFNIIAIFDRCRSTVSVLKTLSSGRKSFEAAGFDMAFQPVAVHVRARMQREYLESSIISFIYGKDATLDQTEIVRKMIDDVHEAFESNINSAETGISQAMEYVLFPKRRGLDIWTLLGKLRKELCDRVPLARLEVERFSLVAEKLQKKSALLLALERIFINPTSPPEPDNHEYVVPWVKGPDGFNAPFSLATKFGDLVFVFHLRESELYHAFVKESVEMMAPRFTLGSAIICVPWTASLEYELATRMADNKRIRVVLEGTDLFDSYMKELCEGTIWGETSS